MKQECNLKFRDQEWFYEQDLDSLLLDSDFWMGVLTYVGRISPPKLEVKKYFEKFAMQKLIF